MLEALTLPLQLLLLLTAIGVGAYIILEALNGWEN